MFEKALGTAVMFGTVQRSPQVLFAMAAQSYGSNVDFATDDSALEYYDRQKANLEALCSNLMNAVIGSQADDPAGCMLYSLLESHNRNAPGSAALQSACIDMAWRSSRQGLAEVLASTEWSFPIDEALVGSPGSALSSQRWAHVAGRGAGAEAETAKRLHDAVRSAHTAILDAIDAGGFDRSVKHAMDVVRQVTRWPTELGALEGALVRSELSLIDEVPPMLRGHTTNHLANEGGSGRLIAVQAALCLNARLRRVVLLGARETSAELFLLGHRRPPSITLTLGRRPATLALDSPRRRADPTRLRRLRAVGCARRPHGAHAASPRLPWPSGPHGTVLGARAAHAARRWRRRRWRRRRWRRRRWRRRRWWRRQWRRPHDTSHHRRRKRPPAHERGADPRGARGVAAAMDGRHPLRALLARRGGLLSQLGRR